MYLQIAFVEVCEIYAFPFKVLHFFCQIISGRHEVFFVISHVFSPLNSFIYELYKEQNVVLNFYAQVS